MYRIVKEENLLSNKVQYFIEQQRGWFSKSWSRNLSRSSINGSIGGQTLDGAKAKLAIIKRGDHIIKSVVYNEI